MVRKDLIESIVNNCTEYIKKWKKEEVDWAGEEYEFLCDKFDGLDDLGRVKIFVACLTLIAVLSTRKGGIGPAAASMAKYAIIQDLVVIDLEHEKNTGKFIPNKGNINDWVIDMLSRPSITPEEEAQIEFDKIEENGPVGHC